MHRSESSRDRKGEATPPVKVVGFHVEGSSPSPRNTTLLQNKMGSSASLSPVIIPPTFQGAAPQRTSGELSPHQAISAAAAAFAQEQISAQVIAPSVRPIRTLSGTDLVATGSGAGGPSGTAPGTPGRAPASSTLPLTPVGSEPAQAASFPLVGTLPSASPFQTAAPAEARASTGSGNGVTSGAAASERRPGAESPQTAAKPRSNDKPPAAEQAVASSKPGAREDSKPPPRQKEMTKAERRALQEAQRAKKAAAKAGMTSAPNGGSSASRPGSRLQKQGSNDNLVEAGRSAVVSSSAQPDIRASGTSAASNHGPSIPKDGSSTAPRSIELFAHLPPFRPTDMQDLVRRGVAGQVPQSVLKLGLALADGSVRGANARCIAMLEVLREVVLSFRSSGTGREVARELQTALNSVIAFLVTCRPLSISMGSAIKAIKALLEALKLEPALPETEVKERVAAAISTFVQEKILFAGDMVARVAAARIRDGDVIITYGYSSVVAAVLLHAARSDPAPAFSVVVVDSRPFHEGRRMLRALLDARVPVQYVSLNGLSYVLPRATKCLLGAGGVLSNGAVLARVGTAAVGMAASYAHVPVLVACETYKFHERVQLDSFTHNELGDPQRIAKTPGLETEWLENWEARPGLGLLSLMYDTMPAQFVSMVITELGAIPPTSVPVVLREFRADGAAPGR